MRPKFQEIGAHQGASLHAPLCFPHSGDAAGGIDHGGAFLELLQEFWHGLQSGNLPPWGYWSYILLALLVAVEGPSVTLFAAVIAATGAMHPGWVFMAAVAGNISADVGWYLLGYLGRFEVWTERFGWLRQQQSAIQRLEQEMRQHTVKILLAAKLTLSLVVPALIATGMARVPWRSWLPIILLGELVWTGGLVLAGLYLTKQIQRLEQGLQMLAIVGAVLFLMVVLWLVRRVFHAPAEHPQE